MRTTITLDPDTAALLQRDMRRRGVSFKEAVNEAIRGGLGGGRGPTASPTTPMSLGVPAVALDRALQIAADLEDDELVRRMRVGK